MGLFVSALFGETTLTFFVFSNGALHISRRIIEKHPSNKAAIMYPPQKTIWLIEKHYVELLGSQLTQRISY
jgi:hypothetical protein